MTDLPQPRIHFPVPNIKGPLLYRLLAADELLWVGVTERSLRKRLQAHACLQPWWAEVASCTFELYRSVGRALDAEWRAINTEHPRHNARTGRPRRATKDGITAEERIWMMHGNLGMRPRRRIGKLERMSRGRPTS